jgi:hypothetical protein
MGNKTETIRRRFATKKCPVLVGFTAKFGQILKELTPVFLKLFHKIKRKGILSHPVLPSYQN